MAKRPHRESARALSFERVESRQTLTAGVIDVSAAGGVLTITGDANNDRLVVTQDHAGDYVIHAGINTTATAGAGVTLDHHRIIVPAADNITTVNANLGAGNNALTWIRGIPPASVNIVAGDGNNVVMFSGIRGESDLSVTLGAGKNYVMVQNAKVGNLLLSLGTNKSDTSQLVGVVDCWITGTTNVTTGAGEDRVFLGSINNSYGDGFSGDVNVDTGGGNDIISIDGSSFEQNLTMSGGTGFNEAYGSASIQGTDTFVGLPWNEIFLDGLPYYQYVPSP